MEGKNGATLSKRDADGVSALIRPETNEQLEMLARMMQTSKSCIIRWAIEEYLAKKLSPSH